MRANEEVSVEYLADAAWERPPASLNANVRTYIANLRRLLSTPDDPGSRLLSTPTGYRLVLRPGELDLAVFEDLAARAGQARELGDDQTAVDLYSQALGLWRGRPLDGLALGAPLRAAVARLDERRLQLVEHRIESRLRLGGHREVVGELRELVAEHPLRESLPEHLMLALYRSGRNAEALQVYQRSRQHLVEELGIEPGPRLRQLQRTILTGTPIERATPTRHPATVTPAQLPTAASAFTGREEECARLDRLLDKIDDGMVTAVISGMAGVGKTALAVHWAHRVADRFPDGQVYLDLRGYASTRPATAAEALGLLFRSLGVPSERIPTDVDAQAAMYRSMLAGKRMLILLDNARSAEQVRPLLPGSSGCLALVTSRDALVGLAALDGAYPIRLDPLSPVESRTLLRRVVDDDRIRDEEDALAELVRLCARLPLALRLAAARLSTQPRHTVGALVARIGRDALSALQSPADPLAAVRVAFDHSYLALDESARRMFRRLALAPGPDFGVPVAAALLDSSPAEAVEPVLDGLVASHLVDEYTAGRYRLHDLLRQYAADRAEAEEAPDERRAAIRRVLIWYRHTAARASEVLDPHRRRTIPLDPPVPDRWPVRFADHGDALAWYEAEHRNLVTAVGQAADHGMHDLAWQLPVTMFSFFELRKHWTDWISTHEIGLAAARRAGAPHAEAWTLNNLGIAEKQLGRVDRAVDRYRQALAIRQRIGDRHGEAVTSNNLGTASNRAGDVVQAIAHYRHALAIFRETGDRWGESLALTNLGEAHRGLGAFDSAVTCFQEALALRRALRDRRGEGIVLNNVANALFSLGRHAEAIGYYREALRIRDSVGDRWGVARTLTNLGTLLETTGELAGAWQCWRRALAIFDDLGDAQATEVRARLRCDQLVSCAAVAS